MQSLTKGTDKLGSGATQVADGIDQLVSTIQTPELLKQINAIKGALSPGTPVDQVTGLLGGLVRLKAGSRQIANELTSPTAQYRGGLNAATKGAGALAVGAGSLATGMGDLNSGAQQLVSGTRSLRDGIVQVDDGSATLSRGLADGVRQVPDLGGEEKQQSLAKLLAPPVVFKSNNIAAAQFAGPGGAPTYLVLGSALIVIVVFMLFRIHRRITNRDDPLSLSEVARRGTVVGLVSLAVVAVFGMVGWWSLSPSPDPASLTKVIAIVAVATLTNVMVTSAFFAIFGYVGGALTSLAVMILQTFAYGGIWMVESLPAPIRWLNAISPMTYTRQGLISAFGGGSGFWSALSVLVIIGVVAAAITLLISRSANRRHRTTATFTPPQPTDPIQPAVG